MNIAYIIAIILLGLPVLLVIATIVFLVRYITGRKQSIENQAMSQTAKMIDSANFFGQKSKGMLQARGNGQLWLTDTELRFEMYLPQKSFTVALNRISRVSTTKTFLGKSQGVPLLYIEFENEFGTDAAAWRVKNHAQWVDALTTLTRPLN